MECSPIKVVDPLAESTIVKLFPQQQLWLYLSAHLNVVEVDYDSKFFQLEKQSVDAIGGQSYVFEQKLDLSNWTEFSCMYLGEIFVLKKDTCSSLCVVLDSKHKPNILTIVNPVGSQVKLRPSQILEVVALEPNKGEPTHWDIKIGDGSFGIKYQEVQHAVINPKTFNFASFNNVEGQFLPYPRVEDAALEHHFWFKVDLDSIKTIWPSGLYDAGKIMLDGRTMSGQKLTNLVSISLRIKAKDRKKMLATAVKPDKILHNIGKNWWINSKAKWFVPMSEEVTLERQTSKEMFQGCRTIETELNPCWKKNRKELVQSVSNRITYEQP